MQTKRKLVLSIMHLVQPGIYYSRSVGLNGSTYVLKRSVFVYRENSAGSTFAKTCTWVATVTTLSSVRGQASTVVWLGVYGSLMLMVNAMTCVVVRSLATLYTAMISVSSLCRLLTCHFICYFCLSFTGCRVPKCQKLQMTA